MIGIIALLFLNPPLTKMHKPILHFFTEEGNYCCHCHIHFSVLITNELNLAHDQRSFSYPVNANSRYHYILDRLERERKDGSRYYEVQNLFNTEDFAPQLHSVLHHSR